MRLRDLSFPIRLVLTGALVMLGIGYAIAMLNLHFTYGGMDGQPGLTMADMRRAFHGTRNVTRLAAKIDGGSMEQYLPDPLQKSAILNWIQDGASESGFQGSVRPILEKNCWRCHEPSGLMWMRPLQTYEQVREVTQVERGEPPPVWARVAHTHLQSIGLVLLVTGLVFCGTGLPDRWKSVIVAAPFASLLIDFVARYLARYHAGLLYVMVTAGAVTGIAFGLMVLVSLHEMWFSRAGGAVQSRGAVAPDAR